MKYRWSPTLGEFEESPESVWGVEPYDPTGTESCVFCGVYSFPDFYALWRYTGKKYVWWCGTDILHLVNGYWLDKEGIIKLNPKQIGKWIDENCESWCENVVEQDLLRTVGIYSEIAPSFLGDVSKFPVSKKIDKKRYYSSVSGNDFKRYGWDKINELALKNPDIEYHLYGNTKKWSAPDNVIVHGRVPKETMNEEIKSMTGCIRLVDLDGFSEIVAKAVLWGQEVISAIDYPFLRAKNPREELLKVLNCYPWNKWR